MTVNSGISVHLVVTLGGDTLRVLLQIYKCVKSMYLDERPSPVTSLGVLITRCEAVWFVQYLWHKEEQDGIISWQLQHCHVAPRFSAPDYPAGMLVATLKLQELEDSQWHIGLSESMLWANHDQTAPPQGFRWLTQYSERLAEKHGLPINPLGSSSSTPTETITDTEGCSHCRAGSSLSCCTAHT